MSFKLWVITASVKTWGRNDSELVSFNSLERFVLFCLVMEHQQGSEGFYPKATQYFLPVLFKISWVKNQNKSNVIKSEFSNVKGPSNWLILLLDLYVLKIRTYFSTNKLPYNKRKNWIKQALSELSFSYSWLLSTCSAFLIPYLVMCSIENEATGD